MWGLPKQSSEMSRSSNGHRLSESDAMIVDCPSQKPTLNITRAVRISHPLSAINSPPSSQVKQYMYEANNVEYLDCCNSSAHVGHCHPQVEFVFRKQFLQTAFQVVCKGQQQMGKLVTAQGFVSENLRKYVKVRDRKYALV